MLVERHLSEADFDDQRGPRSPEVDLRVQSVTIHECLLEMGEEMLGTRDRYPGQILYIAANLALFTNVAADAHIVSVAREQVVDVVLEDFDRRNINLIRNSIILRRLLLFYEIK